jgi:voltage-gated potassium channel
MRRCGVGFNGLRSRSWWLVSAAALRGALAASVLVALYYLLPLDLGDSDASTFVKLAFGAVVFLGLMTWQLRAITQSDNPGLRALEALGLAVPLFLLVFASVYYLMSSADASNFTAPLSRTDALYFTVTIFSTVGFGDITAQAESARLVVAAQMMLDLIVLGLGVRIILEAVQRGRARLTGDASADPASP